MTNFLNVSKTTSLKRKIKKLVMAFMKVVLLILVAAGTCVARDVKESKGKTFPPFTIFDDHHGQYVRVTGPLRLKIDYNISKYPPYKLSDMVHYSIGGYSSVEVLSLFLNGAINYEGMPLITWDGVDDQCILHGGMRCPYPKNKYIHTSGKTNFKDLGLLPGLYQGKADCFVETKQHVRIRLGGVEFAMKVHDG